MKFCDAPIGAKLKFPHNSVIYTRIESKGFTEDMYGKDAEETLAFEKNGVQMPAFCESDSDTYVEVLDE